MKLLGSCLLALSLIAGLQADDSASTIQSLQTSITKLDTQKVRQQISEFDTAIDLQEVIKPLLKTAKTVKAGLRAQLYEASQKSRAWAGVKGIAEIRVGLKLLKQVNFFNALLETVTTFWDPSALFVPYETTRSEAKNGSIQLKPFHAFILSGFLGYWAAGNIKFAYYGTSTLQQKLEKIDQIIQILKAAQKTAAAAETEQGIL